MRKFILGTILITGFGFAGYYHWYLPFSEIKSAYLSFPTFQQCYSNTPPTQLERKKGTSINSNECIHIITGALPPIICGPARDCKPTSIIEFFPEKRK